MARHGMYHSHGMCQHHDKQKRQVPRQQSAVAVDLSPVASWFEYTLGQGQKVEVPRCTGEYYRQNVLGHPLIGSVLV